MVIGRPITALAHILAKIDPANNTNRLNIPAIVKNTELDLFAMTVNDLLDRVQEQIVEERHLRNRVELIAKNFQMIFDLSSNALIVTDPNLNLLTYNPAFQDLVYSATGNRHPPHDASWIHLMVKNPDELVTNILDILPALARGFLLRLSVNAGLASVGSCCWRHCCTTHFTG